MEREKYKVPKVEVIIFSGDVITASTVVQEDGGIGVGFDGDKWGWE